MNISHIVIIDFESQYTQLIEKTVQQLNVFCKIYHYTKLPDSIEKTNLEGYSRIRICMDVP